jgi:hypothetical protein
VKSSRALKVGISADEARAGECGMGVPRKSYEHEPYARIVSDLDSLVQPRMKQSDENNFLGIGLDRSLGRGVTEGPSAAVYVPQLTGSRGVQLEVMHLLNGRLTQNAGGYHRCSDQTIEECQTFPSVSGIHEAPFPTRSLSPETVLRIANSWLHLTACEKMSIPSFIARILLVH